jgi:general secretion pathway protein D
LNKKVNLSINSNISKYELISQVCLEHKISIFIKDKFTKKVLSEDIEYLNLIDVPLDKFFQIIFNQSNIIYSFKDNILELSYLDTQTFKINYLNIVRSSSSKTDVSLKDENSQNTKVTILSNDKIDFWKNIKIEVLSILNDHLDSYKVENITINKDAGLLTITATKNQLERVKKYIRDIKELLHKQVFIDVRIYSVALDKSKNVGINWDGISNLQNLNINAQFNNQGTSFINLDSSVSIGSILDFLEQNGKVRTISNPKIVALNNQPAIISVGEQINYISEESSMTADTTKTSRTVNNIFSGVILDITASISENNEIILKINPSISSVKKNSSSDALPPTLIKKELSSVIKAKEQDKIVLGGLIDVQLAYKDNGVTGLKDIPLFGNIFQSYEEYEQQNELVIIIIPTIKD